MPAGSRHIVALGGGFRDNGAGAWIAGPLIGYTLALTGVNHPRVCLLNTATGDDPRYYSAMYGALAATGARVSHLALFPMPNVTNPRTFLLEQDAVIVGGGSVANQVAVWRTHGLHQAFREAWESGVVLSGASAGAICWFEAGTTDSFGRELRPFTDGLGLLAGSYCPHYDSEPRRRPAFHGLIGGGTIPSGWAADDGVALHFVDDGLAAVLSDRVGASAYRVERSGDGAEESVVTPRLLDTATEGADG